MTNNLILISENIIDNIENIDDLVDSYFEPIKDIADTAGDIFTPIKAVHTLYTLNKKRKFKKFLKSYAKSLENGNFTSLATKERLKNYLKNENNFNFINDSIENAINSKSIYGSVLLGYYVGLILLEELIINFKVIIIVDVLKELNDIELSCFARIYERANIAEEVNIREFENFNWLHLFSDLTIDKLIQLRVVDMPEEKYGLKRKGRFVHTEIAEDIHSLMKASGIYNELLEYKF